MNLEDIMVSEISQTHKDQYCTTLVMWRAKIVKFKKTESRIEVMKGWGKRRLGSHYLTGTEFQPAKMRRFWRWTALMAVQQCECSRLNCALTNGFKRQVSCYVCFITIKQFLIIKNFWDFSSSPVVKTSSFHCRRYSFDHWLGNWDPTCCVVWPNNNNNKSISTYQQTP